MKSMMEELFEINLWDLKEEQQDEGEEILDQEWKITTYKFNIRSKVVLFLEYNVADKHGSRLFYYFP